MSVDDVKDFDSCVEWLNSIGRSDLLSHVRRNGTTGGFVMAFPVIEQMYKAYEDQKTRH